MRNIASPRTVSFEDALRNLASRVTGTPVAELPRTQEAIVQYMADHLPDTTPAVDVNELADELAEAITKEVMSRIGQTPTTGAAAAEEAAGGKPAAKRTRKTTTTE